MTRSEADKWWEQNKDKILSALRANSPKERPIQVLRTHSEKETPGEGLSKTPDSLTRVTSDNADGWAKLGISISGEWPCAIEVNNYGDSRGIGLEVVQYLKEDGKLLVKVPYVEGYQLHRKHDWIGVTPEDTNPPGKLQVAWNTFKNWLGFA